MFEAGEIATGSSPLLLLFECGDAIDEEQFGIIKIVGQLLGPIVADVLVDVGVSLHKEDTAAGCRGRQHFGDTCRAVFLLSGGVKQYVAEGQDLEESFELTGIGRGVARSGVGSWVGIGIGAIDEHNIPQHARVDSDDIDGVVGESERLEVEVGCGDDDGSSSGRSLMSAGCDIVSDECVDQCAFSGPTAAEDSDDEWSFESESKRVDSIEQSSDQCHGIASGLPRHVQFGPRVELFDQFVDPGEVLQSCQFTVAHGVCVEVGSG